MYKGDALYAGLCSYAGVPNGAWSNFQSGDPASSPKGESLKAGDCWYAIPSGDVLYAGELPSREGTLVG